MRVDGSTPGDSNKPVERAGNAVNLRKRVRMTDLANVGLVRAPLLFPRTV